MSIKKQISLASFIFAFLFAPLYAVAEELSPALSMPELITKITMEEDLGGSARLLLKKIAWCESRQRQFDDNGRLVRGIVDADDIGVMQINRRFHEEKAKELGLSIYNTEDNIRYAALLFKEQGSGPWNASRACWG